MRATIVPAKHARLTTLMTTLFLRYTQGIDLFSRKFQTYLQKIATSWIFMLLHLLQPIFRVPAYHYIARKAISLGTDESNLSTTQPPSHNTVPVTTELRCRVNA